MDEALPFGRAFSLYDGAEKGSQIGEGSVSKPVTARTNAGACPGQASNDDDWQNENVNKSHNFVSLVHKKEGNT